VGLVTGGKYYIKELCVNNWIERGVNSLGN
jgi:hypothetical protein